MESDRAARPGLALLALAFYAGHAGYHLASGNPGDTVWMCHLATLLVAAGFLFAAPVPMAIGFLWLIVGDVLWVLDLAGGAALLPTSLLTHVGGLALSLIGLRMYGMPRGTWWKAVLALLVLQQLTRWITPAAANVNVAFAVWSGWERVFPSYAAYRVFLAIGAAALFYGLERVAGRWATASNGAADGDS